MIRTETVSDTILSIRGRLRMILPSCLKRILIVYCGLSKLGFTEIFRESTISVSGTFSPMIRFSQNNSLTTISLIASSGRILWTSIEYAKEWKLCSNSSWKGTSQSLKTLKTEVPKTAIDNKIPKWDFVFCSLILIFLDKAMKYRIGTSIFVYTWIKLLDFRLTRKMG